MSLAERLIAARFGIKKDAVLNGGPPEASPGRPPDPEDLGGILSKLRAEAAKDRVDGLDYGAVARSEAYAEYRRYAFDLRAFDPAELGSRQKRLAFWINLYNGLVLDAVIQWRVERTVREVAGFFRRAAYRMGGLRYSALDIENGILRGNAPHPALPGAPFGPADPRQAHSPDRVDPRVHFALVCASRSCPPLAAYDALHVNGQLDQAARSFIRGGGVELDASQGRIHLSRIFQWYAVDFGARWQA
ncbi:MAG: DUF547 domain-containing protein, partial [Anaerolineales bacterium]